MQTIKYLLRLLGWLTVAFFTTAGIVGFLYIGLALGFHDGSGL